MASGDDEQRTDSPKDDLQIPYIVVEANDHVSQLKRFSSHLIAHCTVYHEVCNKLLKRTLQNSQLAYSQAAIVEGLRNDLKAMNVMFGMMKMFCEQIIHVSTPDPSCLPTLKAYFCQIVEFTREAWRKILTCKELRLHLANEFNNKGMIEVLQRMVAYVRGEETQVTLTIMNWNDSSTSCTGTGTNKNPLPNLFTVEELEIANNYATDDKTWSTLVTSGLGVLKCLAAIGGAALLGAAGGMILGAVVGSVGGPLGMAVGVGMGAKIGATVGAGLGAIHKTVTLDADE